MPRKTKLDRCVRCKRHNATIGALVNYYVVGSKKRIDASSRKAKQIKGSLPTRGYCVDCFLGLAKKHGLPSEKQRALRKKLKPHKHSSGHHKRKSHR